MRVYTHLQEKQSSAVELLAPVKNPKKPKNFLFQEKTRNEKIKPWKKEKAEDKAKKMKTKKESPPDYKTLPPGGCPKFPVFADIPSTQEALPEYSATVYKVANLCIKLEWLSPYDPAPSRVWKDVILELNSTQLNVYSIDLSVSSSSHHPFEITHYMSVFTKEVDLKNLIFFSRSSLLTHKNLVKSYSLQHAKIGVASDYGKRDFTVRIRAETDQFLVQFSGPTEMIDWYNALCLARDNALDLGHREMPRYRTVPRRRHRACSSSSCNSGGSFARRLFRRKSAPEISSAKIKKLSPQDLNVDQLLNDMVQSFNISQPPVEPIVEVVEEQEQEQEEMEDYQASSDESDQEDRPVAVSENSSNIMSSISTLSSRTTTYSQEKWIPDMGDALTKRKTQRDAIRCMQTLNATERWAGKVLVKPVKPEAAKNFANRFRSHSLGSERQSNDVVVYQEFLVSSRGLIPKR